MNSRRFRGILIAVVAALLLGSLGYLQTLHTETELLSSLVACTIIGVASLIGFLFLPVRPIDLVCLLSVASFTTYVVLRAMTSPDGYAARSDLYLVLGALVVYLIAASLLSSAMMRNAIIGVLLVFGFVHVAVSVTQAGVAKNYSLLIPALADVRLSVRGAGLYVNPDHLAGLLEVIGVLGLSVTCWSRWPHWARVVLAYLTGICYLGLALTGSRGGYLSTTLSVIVFASLSFVVLRAGGATRLLRYGSIGFALLAMAIAATSLFVHQTPALHERAANTFTVDEGRLDIWRAAVTQWKLNRIFGTGSGTFLFYGREFLPASFQADPVEVHNDYLHLLCEYGVVGGVLFLVFFCAHVRAGLRTFMEFGPRRVQAGTTLRSNRVALSIGALSALAACGVHSAVDFNMHIPANALVIAAVFGMLANIGMDESSQSQAMIARLPFRITGIVIALIVLVQAARLIPGEYYAEQAGTALREEYPEAAIVFGRKALKFERYNPYIFFYLGRAYSALAGSDKRYENARTLLYERALSAFDRARRLSPLDRTYLLDMASVYDSLGRFPEAEWMYYLARPRDPHSETVENMYLTHLDAWQNGAAAPTR